MNKITFITNTNVMITLMLVIILFIGVDVKGFFDLNRSYGVLDFFIFKKFLIFRLKVRIHNEFIYLKLGKSYKKFVIKKKSTDEIKLKFPRIKIKKLKLKMVFGNRDNARFTTDIWLLSKIFGGNLSNFLKHKFHIKNYSFLMNPTYIEDAFKISLYGVINFSILKIIFHYLHKIILTKRYNKKHKEIKNEDRRIINGNN